MVLELLMVRQPPKISHPNLLGTILNIFRSHHLPKLTKQKEWLTSFWMIVWLEIWGPLDDKKYLVHFFFSWHLSIHHFPLPKRSSDEIYTCKHRIIMEYTPLDSMFLFRDKEYEKLGLSNQVISINSIIFANEHPFWLFGAHELKHISSWLVRFRNHDNPQGFYFPPFV